MTGRTFGHGFLVIAVAVSGCTSTLEPIERDEELLLQTDRLAYDLDRDDLGFETEIPYAFTNRTGAAVYLVNCGGAWALRLDRKVGNGWEQAWGPVIPSCLSPPIVIEAGEVFSDTLRVWGSRPGRDAHPQWDVADPSGTYRIVWVAALSSFEDRVPFGPQIPLEHRVSNAFHLKR